MADVDRIRTTVELFKQLDDRFGGGHARQSLVQYLSTDAERMLQGRYNDAVGRALFFATAEASLLATWMSYDSAPSSSLAQRYRSARTRPVRQAFLNRFEREVDPDGELPPDERRSRAEHAKRAVAARRAR
jgi:hypothetical protein